MYEEWLSISVYLSSNCPQSPHTAKNMLLPFWISIIIETSLKLLLLDESKMNSV
jgi:hypothetical protein